MEGRVFRYRNAAKELRSPHEDNTRQPNHGLGWGSGKKRPRCVGEGFQKRKWAVREWRIVLKAVGIEWVRTCPELE